MLPVINPADIVNPTSALPDGYFLVYNRSGVAQLVPTSLIESQGGDAEFNTVQVNSTLAVTGTSSFTGAVTFAAPSIYSSETGITAGTTQTQAGATQLTKEFNNVTTVAVTNDGVKLPTAVAGLFVTVKNTGANTALIYPFLGDFIDDELVNAPISIPAEAEIQFRCISSTVWESNIENINAGNISASTANITTANITTINSVTDNAVTFVTRDEDRNISITENNITAGGADTDVDVNITAKGAGVVWVNVDWGVNQSGTLVPASNNTFDIGNGAVNPRDVNASRNVNTVGVNATSVTLVKATNGVIVANAVTVNGFCGTLETPALTNAAGAGYTVTFTNNTILATSNVTLQIRNYAGAMVVDGVPFIVKSTPTPSTIVFNIYNIHATNALNGVVLIDYIVN